MRSELCKAENIKGRGHLGDLGIDGKMCECVCVCVCACVRIREKDRMLFMTVVYG
jgi:hypothetical protein